MLRDLPGVAQWTADQFWSQIQWVAQQGATQKARLDAQKIDLQHAYTAARNANDQAKMDALTPLIHQNSELRVQWTDLRTKFNNIVEMARAKLKEYGVNEPPTLAGLGFVQGILIPIAWVAALIAVIVIVHEINDGITAISKALEKLGPVGGTAVSLAVLGVVGIAAYLLVVKPNRRVAA